MKKLKLLLLSFVIITLQFCKKSTSDEDSAGEEETTYQEEIVEEAYPDGTYCADVEYYNSNTGTRNTYTLNVEVENNELTIVHWPNGGWLDESHFTPQELDSDGSCSFTSDTGYEYQIQINGPECSFTDESRISRDVEDDKEALTCPECGDEKDEYDDYCYYCLKKFTCPECRGRKDKFDDICNDCKSKQEEEEEESNQE